MTAILWILFITTTSHLICQQRQNWRSNYKAVLAPQISSRRQFYQADTETTFCTRAIRRTNLIGVIMKREDEEVKNTVIPTTAQIVLVKIPQSVEKYSSATNEKKNWVDWAPRAQLIGWYYNADQAQMTNLGRPVEMQHSPQAMTSPHKEISPWR